MFASPCGPRPQPSTGLHSPGPKCQPTRKQPNQDGEGEVCAPRVSTSYRSGLTVIEGGTFASDLSISAGDPSLVFTQIGVETVASHPVTTDLRDRDPRPPFSLKIHGTVPSLPARTRPTARGPTDALEWKESQKERMSNLEQARGLAPKKEV